MTSLPTTHVVPSGFYKFPIPLRVKVSMLSQISYNITQIQNPPDIQWAHHKFNGQIHKWIYKPRTLILGSDRCLVLISWDFKSWLLKTFYDQIGKLFGTKTVYLKLHILPLTSSLYPFFSSADRKYFTATSWSLQKACLTLPNCPDSQNYKYRHT